MSDGALLVIAAAVLLGAVVVGLALGVSLTLRLQRRGAPEAERPDAQPPAPRPRLETLRPDDVAPIPGAGPGFGPWRRKTLGWPPPKPPGGP